MALLFTVKILIIHFLDNQNFTFIHTMLCLVTQSCPTLYDPIDCSPPDSSVHGDSPGKNTGVGRLSLLQGIFPIQESNRGLLHCKQILYQLCYQRSPVFIIFVCVCIGIYAWVYLYTLFLKKHDLQKRRMV